MRRTGLVNLCLTAAVLLVVAIGCVACDDLGGTGTTGASLAESTTSGTALSPVPGETTTTASVPAATTVTSRRPTAASTTLPPPATAPPYDVTNRYEEDDPRLAWSGIWSLTGDPSDSGGTCRFAEHAGCSVKIHFYGVSVSFITRTGPAVGEARITLDGSSPVTIDCYSPDWSYQQIVWWADPIEPGSHTLQIECPGTSNPASASKGIYVDAFAVTGTLE